MPQNSSVVGGDESYYRKRKIRIEDWVGRDWADEGEWSELSERGRPREDQIQETWVANVHLSSRNSSCQCSMEKILMGGFSEQNTIFNCTYCDERKVEDNDCKLGRGRCWTSFIGSRIVENLNHGRNSNREFTFVSTFDREARLTCGYLQKFEDLFAPLLNMAKDVLVNTFSDDLHSVT